MCRILATGKRYATREGYRRRNDTIYTWRSNPDSKHFRTDSQSESERRPITRISRWNPACLQSGKAQSVEFKKLGARDVIKPHDHIGPVSLVGFG